MLPAWDRAPAAEPARSSRQLEQLAQLGVGGTRSSPSAGGSRRRAAGAVLLSCNTRCMSHQVSMCWSQVIRASGFSMCFGRWQPSLSKGSTSCSRSFFPSRGSLPGAAVTSAEGSSSSSGSSPSTTPWRPPREARPRSRAVARGACGAAGATAAGSDRGETHAAQSSRPAFSLFNFTKLSLIPASFWPLYMGYPGVVFKIEWARHKIDTRGESSTTKACSRHGFALAPRCCLQSCSTRPF